jgi:hypothetical protein
MNVYLEQFSEEDAHTQAKDVNRLVESQSDWLKVLQPGTLARYESVRKARKNILRLATTPSFEAYMVKTSNTNVAIGLATIIFGQSIIHPNPEVGKFDGHDLDYWLGDLQSTDVHREVADDLVLASAGFSIARERHPSRVAIEEAMLMNPLQSHYQVLAAVPIDRPVNRKPLGLMANLKFLYLQWVNQLS